MDLDNILKAIPLGLRSPLVLEYEELLRASLHADWEKVGLKAGKICEIVYSILEGFLSGTYSTGPSKPKNMMDACVALEKNSAASLPRSARIQIPRVIIAIYELRNNRSIGHTSGDLSPNEMDGVFFLHAVKWIMGELVRLFVGLDVKAAQAVINSITTKWSPLIWEKDGEKRALTPSTKASDRVLILLYFSSLTATREELQRWSEYRNSTDFKRKVLDPLHKKLFLFFNASQDLVSLLPAGVAYVEKLLRQFA
jgi:hypothetical protein